MAVLVGGPRRDGLQRAIDSGAAIVGVNSRNLRTLTVDPDVHVRLASAACREGVVAVAESGLRTQGRPRSAWRRAGYSAFLVGERLIGAGRSRRARCRTLRGAS